MTPAQQLEVNRFTDAMWVLLRYAERMHPRGADVYGPVLHTARILERRGFLKVTGRRKAYSVCLTEAGHDALQETTKRR